MYNCSNFVIIFLKKQKGGANTSKRKVSVFSGTRIIIKKFPESASFAPQVLSQSRESER